MPPQLNVTSSTAVKKLQSSATKLQSVPQAMVQKVFDDHSSFVQLYVTDHGSCLNRNNCSRARPNGSYALFLNQL